ncbi:hypothetical protein NPIL_560451 [Nephila pilipes]|uniref:Uncharacterized protein n=1 Tax=Nephila pilipes TaxID=299642 RepID=A0A8X6NWU7_NEPPI|nr:hypothetical protein NPIL_560451 [Nephila pilipes]
MPRKKVFLTRSDFPEIGIKKLQEKYETYFSPESPICTEEYLLQHIGGADALFCVPPIKIDKKVLDTADQVRIYHPRERDEGVVETNGLGGEESRAEQVETEGSKGLASEETSKEKQWRGKRMRSEGSTESSNKRKRQLQRKRWPPVRRNWGKRNAPSLVENKVKRRPHENIEKEANSGITFIRSRNKKNDQERSSGRKSSPVRKVQFLSI